MTLSLIIPIAAAVAAAAVGGRKWSYVLLVLAAFPAPAAATVIAAIALAWLSRRYAANARPIAAMGLASLASLAIIGWFVGTGPSLHGYGAFSLLFVLAGLLCTAVTAFRVITAEMEPVPASEPAVEQIRA